MVAASIEAGAILAALGAAVFFSMEQIWAKRGIEAGGSPLLASLLVAVVSMVVFGGYAVLRADLAALVGRSTWGLGVFLFAGAVSSGIGILAIYEGVDRVGASVNTAVTNSRPLFVAVLGFFLLSEPLGLTTIVGIVILVGGLVLIALSRGGDVRGWHPVELVFPVAAATAFAMGNVARRYGLTRTDVPLIEGIAVNAVGGLLVLGVYVLATRQEEIVLAPRSAYGWFLVTGASTAAALLSLFTALELERAAIVDSIVATAPLLTLVLTVLVLRDFERVTRRVVAGAALVVIGAVLIVGL